MSYKTYFKVVKETVIDGIGVVILGCYDEDTPNGKYDWYDINRKDGELVGYHLRKRPTKKIIQKLLKKVWTRKEILNMNDWGAWSK